MAIKLTFNGIGVFTTAGIRFSIAAMVIFLWARSTRQLLALKKNQFHQIVIVALALVTFGILVVHRKPEKPAPAYSIRKGI